jgi:hypothetical protein
MCWKMVFEPKLLSPWSLLLASSPLILVLWKLLVNIILYKLVNIILYKAWTIHGSSRNYQRGKRGVGNHVNLGLKIKASGTELTLGQNIKQNIVWLE